MRRRKVAQQEDCNDHHGNEKTNEERDLQDAVCPICLSTLGLTVPSPSASNQIFLAETSNTAPRKNKRRWAVCSYDADEDLRCGNVEEDVLSLRVCGHSFHAGCLVSWFLIGRFDCPLCKAKYFDRPIKDTGLPGEV